MYQSVRYLPVMSVAAIFYRLWSAFWLFSFVVFSQESPVIFFLSKSLLNFFYACWYVRFHFISDVASLGPASDISSSLSSSPLICLEEFLRFMHLLHTVEPVLKVCSYFCSLQLLQMIILCFPCFPTFYQELIPPFYTFLWTIGCQEVKKLVWVSTVWICYHPYGFPLVFKYSISHLERESPLHFTISTNAPPWISFMCLEKFLWVLARTIHNAYQTSPQDLFEAASNKIIEPGPEIFAMPERLRRELFVSFTGIDRSSNLWYYFLLSHKLSHWPFNSAHCLSVTESCSQKQFHLLLF